VQDGSISFGEDKAEVDNPAGLRSQSYDENELDALDDSAPVKLRRSDSYTQRARAMRERLAADSRGQKFATPGLHAKPIRGAANSRGNSRRGLYKSGTQITGRFSSLPRPLPMRRGLSAPVFDGRENFASVAENRPFEVAYLSKLYWACSCIGYPPDYADFVGSQFLGLQSSHPVTHINGQVPVVSELVEFVVQMFMQLVKFFDLVLVFIDDFQVSKPK
jgi:hypothetical protein